MTKTEENIILRDALEKYGRRQLLQTCEELAELIQAISKADRNNGQSYIDGVTEEIADVSIMIQQVQAIFGISDADILKERERKLRRLGHLVRKCP